MRAPIGESPLDCLVIVLGDVPTILASSDGVRLCSRRYRLIALSMCIFCHMAKRNSIDNRELFLQTAKNLAPRQKNFYYDLSQERRNGVSLAPENSRGSKMDAQQLYDKIWALMVAKLIEESGRFESNPYQVAKRIKVPASTVKRWIEGDRGQKNVSLIKVLQILQGLNVPIDELVKVLYPDQAEVVLGLLQHDKDMLLKLLTIFEVGGDEMKKICNDIEYTYKKATESK
jgi:transcriptional regulator with XRE-family HTH domain